MTSQKKAKPVSEYAQINALVTDGCALVGGAINYEVADVRNRGEDTPIYRFHSDIELVGTITYPDDRQGLELRVNVYARELHPGQFSETLDDYHVRDERGVRTYRKRGDRKIPIYKSPDSVGYIEKRRGTKIWDCCVWLPPATVSDMLTLLSTGKQLYLIIDEVKTARRRRVRGVTLQSKVPDE